MTMTMAGGLGGGTRNLEHIYIYTEDVEVLDSYLAHSKKIVGLMEKTYQYLLQLCDVSKYCRGGGYTLFHL